MNSNQSPSEIAIVMYVSAIRLVKPFLCIHNMRKHASDGFGPSC